MSIYHKDVSHIATLDPYRLQELYQMHPCAEHVVKKMIVAGARTGGKTVDEDIADCIWTLQRWQEMRAEDAAYAAKPQHPSWATHTLIGFDGERQFVRSDGKGSFLAYTQESAVASHIYTPNNFDMSTLVSLGRPAVIVSPGIDATCEAGSAFVSRYDWSTLSGRFNWIARNPDGKAFAFSGKPTRDSSEWKPLIGSYERFRAGDVPAVDGDGWIFTLESRPATAEGSRYVWSLAPEWATHALTYGVDCAAFVRRATADRGDFFIELSGDGSTELRLFTPNNYHANTLEARPA